MIRAPHQRPPPNSCGRLKRARTSLAFSMVTVQAPTSGVRLSPPHSPSQPAKSELPAGIAISVTVLLGSEIRFRKRCRCGSSTPLTQLIPVGLLVDRAAAITLFRHRQGLRFHEGRRDILGSIHQHRAGISTRADARPAGEHKTRSRHSRQRDRPALCKISRAGCTAIDALSDC